MKILIAPSWYPTEDNPGSGVFFRDQALALANAGHMVVLLYVRLYPVSHIIRRNMPQAEIYFDNGVKIYIYPANSFGANRCHRVCERIAEVMPEALKYVMKREGAFDIAHAHSFIGAGYALCKCKKQLQCPVIVTEHISSIPDNKLNRKELSCLKQCVDLADRFIAVSDDLARCIASVTGCKRKINVIPNIFASDFYPSEKGEKSNIFNFVSVGGLIKLKQMDLLIRCFVEAFGSDDSVRLTIVGDGPERDSLEHLAAEGGVRRNIIFAGYQPRVEIANLMRESDAFVMLSRRETFGVVYIEAMACGLPVVGTLNGGADEILNTYGATAVEVGNSEQIVRAMRDVKSKYNNFDKKIISENAIAQYGERTVMNELSDIYMSTLSEEV